MIQYAYTILYVTSVEDSILFYEKAFGFQRKFIAPDQTYGELSSGAVTIAMAEKNVASKNFSDGFTPSSLQIRPFGIELGFTVENVDYALEKALQAGAKLVELPIIKPWGQTVAYIRDVDGFLIELCTPMEN